MQQKNLPRNRWVYRGLRIVAAITTILLTAVVVGAVILALAGDTQLLADLLETESGNLKLSTVAQVSLTIAGLLCALAFGLLFASINRLLKHAEQGELFLESATKALSRMGFALILLYLTMLCFEVLLPALIEPAPMSENIVDLLFSAFDFNALILLMGAILIALSGALREGREFQDELRQIV